MKFALITFGTKTERHYKLVPKGKDASALAQACAKFAQKYTAGWNVDFMTKRNTNSDTK